MHFVFRGYTPDKSLTRDLRETAAHCGKLQSDSAKGAKGWEKRRKIGRPKCSPSETFFVRVKPYELLQCYMSMESGFETANDTRSPDPLARRLAAGDLDAPRDLVERHHPELYRYALALLRDASAAEDIVQGTFERAFAALGKYPEERIRALRLRPWLYRIALNLVRNAWRDRRREELTPETPEGPDGHLGASFGFAFGPNREAWMDALSALGRLPEGQRVAVTLRYLEDLPYAGISEATGWPECTCRTLVRRGIGRLDVLLGESDAKGGIR